MEGMTAKEIIQVQLAIESKIEDYTEKLEKAEQYAPHNVDYWNERIGWLKSALAKIEM